MNKFYLISFLLHCTVLGIFSAAGVLNRSIILNLKFSQGLAVRNMPLINTIELADDSGKDDPSDKDIKSPASGQESISARAGIKGIANEMKEGVKNPEPDYPEMALKWRWQGTVRLKIRIRHGRAEDIQLVRSSGYDILDQSARDSVRTWRFPYSSEHLTRELDIEYKIK